MESRNNDEFKKEPETKLPIVISLTTITGGIGKTRITLCKTNLSPAFAIDTDINNSETFIFKQGENVT
jgi:hypothetical protein